MDQIALMIDRMGEASSKAQQLPQTITTMSRFAGTNQRLYLKVEKNSVQGLLKVGERTIFYRDFTGKCKELNPVCVLDFYVHESLQRMGIGNLLFMNMVRHERVLPNKLAYDRPSPKLLKFLAKHYDLASYVPQNNNFVIYDAFWKVRSAHPELRDP
jgi:alpha-tubulin N-acetyltransferase 1